MYNEFRNTGLAGQGNWENVGAIAISSTLLQYNSLVGCMSYYDSGTDAFHKVASVGYNDRGYMFGQNGGPSIWDVYSRCGYLDGA